MGRVPPGVSPSSTVAIVGAASGGRVSPAYPLVYYGDRWRCPGGEARWAHDVRYPDEYSLIAKPLACFKAEGVRHLLKLSHLCRSCTSKASSQSDLPHERQVTLEIWRRYVHSYCSCTSYRRLAIRAHRDGCRFGACSCRFRRRGELPSPETVPAARCSSTAPWSTVCRPTRKRVYPRRSRAACSALPLRRMDSTRSTCLSGGVRIPDTHGRISDNTMNLHLLCRLRGDLP